MEGYQIFDFLHMIEKVDTRNMILLTFCICGSICNFLEAIQKGTQNHYGTSAKNMKHGISQTYRADGRMSYIDDR